MSILTSDQRASAESANLPLKGGDRVIYRLFAFLVGALALIGLATGHSVTMTSNEVLVYGVLAVVVMAGAMLPRRWFG